MSKKQNQKPEENLASQDNKAAQNDELKIEELTKRMVALEEQLKRAVADYRNLEKRVRDDSLALVARLRAEFLIKLIPILDQLEQAVKGGEEGGNQNGWLQGVKISVKQLRQVLAEEGLVQINGEQFDPAFHEAVDTAEGEEGKVLKYLQSGYILDGKVIKPAKVVVGKKGENHG